MKFCFVLFYVYFLPPTLAFEPITGLSFIVGAAVSYYSYYAKDSLKSRLDSPTLCSTYRFYLGECCGANWITADPKELRTQLKNNLYGQHIVELVIPAAIESAIAVTPPSKPLVLSFHGPTGVGKNYVASFIIQNYFQEAEYSKFYHYFNGRAHFPYQEQYLIYQEELRDWITGNVSVCPWSIFVFDEVDKMPTKVLDGIKHFLDHHTTLKKVDYRRAVFIFISNIGSHVIMERYLELWRVEGKKREDMKVNDFDKVINKGAFNEPGGFKMSDIIDHNLIDFYIPFLPLEKSHIEKCIKKAAEEISFKNVDQKFIDEIMKSITFGPEPEALFVTTGCKRINQQVRTHANIFKYGSSFEV